MRKFKQARELDMSELVISGGHIVTPLEERLTDLHIVGDRIADVGRVPLSGAPKQQIDASGCWVTPGLFDLQVNGGPECDFWGDPTVEQVEQFAKNLAQHGVTAILPTLITDDLDHLRKNIDFLEKARQRRMPVRMPGIHLEGPCLSPEKPGVHPPQHIAPLTMDVIQRIIAGPVKLITLAPEKDPSGKTLAALAEKGVVVSLGHSNATFEEAQTAFDRGISMMTHTFNALPPIHHRSPGAVTAALLDERVWCCVICDGKHVSEPAAKLIFRTKGARKSILVTDIAHVGTSQGGLVGSSIMLDEAVRNAVRWGALSFQDAILAASYNPAKAMGCENEFGHLAPGKQADIVIWDKQTLAIKHVISAGELIA
jgi:N-acetylglucosamine-6-phosphate deacetylase